MPPAVRATGLTRTYAGTPVVAGVDLAVEAGELVAVLGPNGAGKTTLLRLLALLLTPSAGRLEVFGVEARAATPALRRRIGWLGHESACYADLSAAENLAFHARLFGLPDAPARVAEALAWAGLDATGRRPVRVFSRGMAQRLALARALLHAPDLLLLDEPWSGLDRQAAAALDDRLAALRTAGHAILLTTHDVERAAALATRIAIMHRGRIVSVEEGNAPHTVIAAVYESVIVRGRA